MAIVQTVNFSSFCDAFVRMNRAASFSYDAKKAIFDYLEEVSDNDGNDFELDIIAICCEYSEDSAENINEEYSLSIEKEEDEDQEDYIERLNEEVQEYLEDNTTVILSENGNFVFVQF